MVKFIADEIDTASRSAPDTLRLRTVFATVPYSRRSLATAGSVWNQIPDAVRQRRLALDVPALSPRELACASPTPKVITSPRLRSVRKPYHRIKALPHVIPAPIAIIAMRSPG